MDIQLLPNHQAYLDKFLTVCQKDKRIIAALLVGSYIKGRNDEHSDLDLYLITTDDTYEDFSAGREVFVRQIGEPSFMENFDLPGIIFLIFSDGTEVEISYERESRMSYVLSEPFKVLLDKKNVTTNVFPRRREADHEGQREKLRRLIHWFWHEMSHFTTALGRGHLWWAHGQLSVLRTYCMNLARLRNDFSDPGAGEEGFFKIENTLSTEQLSPLQETFCPMEKDAMLKAGFVLLQFYKDHARPLSLTHGIHYSEDLERAMLKRLIKLR